MTLKNLFPRELFSNMSWLLAGQLVEKGAVFVATIILARHLAVSDYAAFNYFLLTTAMLAAYAAMGMGVTANRYFAAFDVNSEEQMGRVAPLLGISVVLSLAASFITAVLPPEIILGRFELPVWAIPVGVFFYTFSVVPINALSGMEKFTQLFYISVSGSAVLLFFVIAAVQNGDALLALLGIIGSAMTRSVLGLFLLGRYLRWSAILKHMKLSREKLSHIFSFSFPMFLVSILAGSAAWLVGRIIAGGAGGEKEFALFTIGLQWFSIAMFLPGIISRVTFPRIVRSLENPTSTHELRNNLVTALTLSGVPLFVLSLIMLVVAPYVSRLYGENYHLDGVFILLFFLAAAFSAMALMVGNAIIAGYGQWSWMKLHFIHLLVLSVITYILRDMGAVAGAWAYLVSTITLCVGAYMVLRIQSIKRNKLVVVSE